jgi:hypothetical protein
MTEYKGEYVDATVIASSLMMIEVDGSTLYLDRDKALDLLEAINAVLPAMAVNIEARQAVRAAMARAETAAYPGDTYRL